MDVRRSVLCPIDFSPSSAGALRYAAAIASRFGARAIVLSVEEPVITEAVDLGTGIVWSPEQCTKDMKEFATQTFGPESPMLAACEYHVAVGHPAPEILRVAREHGSELIVMSSHGLTGMRKLFFGATTERVLRETTKPVLVTPPHDTIDVRFDRAKALIRRILVPVDLSPASLAQVQAARTLAETLAVPMIVVHVIEPLTSRLAARMTLAALDTDRRAAAENGLDGLLATLPKRLHAEALIAYGDPAEELSKIVRDRHVGLVIMGLYASANGLGMGSVTYRLICLTPVLVLALPLRLAASPADAAVTARAVEGGVESS